MEAPCISAYPAPCVYGYPLYKARIYYVISISIIIIYVIVESILLCVLCTILTSSSQVILIEFLPKLPLYRPD